MATVNADTYFDLDATNQDRLVEYLGLSAFSDDPDLSDLWEAARDAADHYLNSAFTDDEGADLTAHRIPVRLGILAWIAAMREELAKRSPGVNRVKTWQLERSWAVTMLLKDPGLEAAKKFWKPHAKYVHLHGDG